MTKLAIEYILWGVILLLAQVIVFNHLSLFGVAVPFAFVYIILRLPITMSVNWVMTIAFFIGLLDDVFSDTQGMNALACTILAVSRKPVCRLYIPREEDLPDPQLTIHTLGLPVYIKYILTMALIYCTLVFFIEAFGFFDPLRLTLRIVSSTLLTTIVLLAIDSLTLQKREKRL